MSALIPWLQPEVLRSLAHYLRQMVKILKAKIDSPSVDYPKLAKDLFWMQKGKQDNILMDWARAYYQKHFKKVL